MTKKEKFLKFEDMIDKDEFLSPELEEIRSYVLEYRKEDIAHELNIYDLRELSSFYSDTLDILADDIATELSEKLNNEGVKNKKFSWDTIKEYEYETEDGSVTQPYTGKSEDYIKFLYLRGVLECQLWLQGEKKEQKVYPVPDHQKLSLDEKDQFFHEQPLQFSLVCMKKFWEKFLNIPPKKRPKSKHFFKWSLSSINEKPDMLNVYAKPHLTDSYFEEGKGKSAVIPRKFSHLQGEMKVISCQTDNNSAHAGIINYITWQDYLHIEKGGSPISNPVDKLISKAESDNQKVPEQVNAIFRKMVKEELLLSDLSVEDRQIIKQAEKKIPKVRPASRYIQLSLIQLKKKRVFRETVETAKSNKNLTQIFSDDIKKLKDYIASLLPEIFEIIIWKEQFAQSKKRTAKEYELESGITIGYREGEYVVLLEDSDKNSEKMKKNIQSITNILKSETSTHAYQAHVLIQDENDQWEFFEEIDELTLPIKIKDKKNIHKRFIMILDKENRLEDSSEIITDIFNGEVPNEKPSKTAVVIIIEVAENHGGGK